MSILSLHPNPKPFFCAFVSSPCVCINMKSTKGASSYWITFLSDYNPSLKTMERKKKRAPSVPLLLPSCQSLMHVYTCFSIYACTDVAVSWGCCSSTSLFPIHCFFLLIMSVFLVSFFSW
ncbi:hypothetical protein, unlikely [Trypanosoma congolense IL3000]|uniref:Uncharacterized protein n=1 Tax=Trypanosoma congolense (strain IL3000) TaxID=1068625 RepID=F9W6Y9_TRYCI|nr:hypothetical protein, unlikely [Trypanosoma congolense IL3000]